VLPRAPAPNGEQDEPPEVGAVGGRDYADTEERGLEHDPGQEHPVGFVNSVAVICRGIPLTRADANAPAVRAERARDLERDLPLRLIRPAA